MADEATHLRAPALAATLTVYVKEPLALAVGSRGRDLVDALRHFVPAFVLGLVDARVTGAELSPFGHLGLVVGDLDLAVAVLVESALKRAVRHVHVECGVGGGEGSGVRGRVGEVLEVERIDSERSGPVVEVVSFAFSGTPNLEAWLADGVFLLSTVVVVHVENADLAVSFNLNGRHLVVEGCMGTNRRVMTGKESVALALVIAFIKESDAAFIIGNL